MRDPACPLPYLVGLQRGRYWLNWIATVPLTVLFGGAGVLLSLFDSRGHATHACARNWSRCLLRVAGVHVTTTGLEHLQPGQHYVFAANHHSALDIPAVLANMPLRVRMLAKASLFRIPFLGWYMGRAGYVPVHRRDARRAREAMREGGRQLHAGGSILVFPQGTRTPERDVTPFKKGAVHLARSSGLPLVPMAIVNAGRLMLGGGWRADPGVIELRLGEPFEPDAEATPRAATDELRRRVLLLLDG